MLYQTTFQKGENLALHNTSCATCYTHDNDMGYPLHFHEFYEISYNIEGNFPYTINGKEYNCTENSFVFFPPYTFHSLGIKKGRSRCMTLQFSQNLILNSTSFTQQEYLVCTRNVPEGNAVPVPAGSVLHRILNEISSFGAMNNVDAHPEWEKPIMELGLNGLTLSFLYQLITENYLTFSPFAGRNDELVHLQPVFQVLSEHPDRKLSLQEAADLACMGYSHFSRLFHKFTGYGFSEYTNLIRIREAENLLVNTNKSVTEVALHLHFDSLSYFNKVFKRYSGVTPSVYRMMNAKQYPIYKVRE